jgi:spermidine synthase
MPCVWRSKLANSLPMSAPIPSHSASDDTAPAVSRLLPVLLLLFIGSGCAALIYEVVWLQMLSLVVGASGVSLGVILGTFMGGMCLGSMLLPRFLPKTAHPLRVYAVLELGIGLYALLVLAGLPWLEAFYARFGSPGNSDLPLRAIVSGLCLLPPTMMMGATLPAMARWIKATPAGVSWLGFFYGGNTFGAVIGCLLAGFVLLRNHDMPYATWVAFGLNVVVALVAFALSAFAPHTAQDSEPEATAEPAPAAAPGAKQVYLVIALSGLTALGAEVVWTRQLSLLFGASVYNFSIILAVFLAGLGIGSSVGSMVARDARSPRLLLGVTQLLLALALAWTAWTAMHSLPYWPIKADLYPTPKPWFNFQMDLARCAWTVLPGAILWGASFPLALAAVATRRSESGRLVGTVYGANTVGAILGALGFSLWLLPALGSQGAQRLLIALVGVAAAVAIGPMILPSREEAAAGRGPRFGLGLGLAVGLAMAGWCASTVTPPNWVLIAYGRFAPTYADFAVINEKRADGVTEEKDVPQNGSSDVYGTYVGEGMNVSVVVSMTGQGVRSFHGAGKVQASNQSQDMHLQRMLGHLSVLAHKEPDKVKKVLVVACGAGVTAGSFIPYPNVEEITIVDIEPFVPKFVTPRFTKENYGITDGLAKPGGGVENPRFVTNAAGKKTKVTVVFDDGRHFLHTTKEKFDVITSDPIDPWVKGCAALNTVEYYQMAKDHLNPGGVMSLWIPIYESNLDTTKSVLGTFFKVYKNGIFWSNDIKGEGYDAVLFGRQDDDKVPEFNLDEMQARIDRPEYALVKQSLSDYDFHSAIDLMATYAGHAPSLTSWMSDAQLNTDRNLRLQYLAGMWLNSFKGREILSDILRYYRFPRDMFTGSPERVNALEAQLAREGRDRFAHNGVPDATMQALVEAIQRQPPAPAAPPANPPAP